MMNLNSVIERLNRLGYRKSTGRSFTDEGLPIIDFRKGNKGMTMYSAYLNEYDSVEYVEKTRLRWNEAQRKYVPVTEKIHRLEQII